MPSKLLKTILTLVIILVSGLLAAGAGYKGGQWINEQRLNKLESELVRLNNNLVETEKIKVNSEKSINETKSPVEKSNDIPLAFNQKDYSGFFLRNRVTVSRGNSDLFDKIINLDSYKVNRTPSKPDDDIGPVITGPFLENRGTYIHKGIDISIPVGTEVKAVFDGKFYKGDQGATGFGKYVYIEHDNGLVTYYGHLSEWAHLEDGRKVQSGHIIGLSGNTGDSSGPHLHYEVRKGEESLNPLEYLK